MGGVKGKTWDGSLLVGAEGCSGMVVCWRRGGGERVYIIIIVLLVGGKGGGGREICWRGKR